MLASADCYLTISTLSYDYNCQNGLKVLLMKSGASSLDVKPKQNSLSEILRDGLCQTMVRKI